MLILITFSGDFVLMKWKCCLNMAPTHVMVAHQVGNKLAYAWSHSHPSQQIPYGGSNFTTNTPTSDTNSVAGAGTLILEFDFLSHYTGHQTLCALADKYMKAIMTRSEHKPTQALLPFKAELPQGFPVLPSLDIYPGNASFADDYITWGGGIKLSDKSYN
ncbi:hypothetical protein DFH28DRAFT_927721 [Melampsora americana]|nr:hypothetical protein DFH28DRAFT_927721 [Melampsora americana]